jgi:quinoprotein relay system zinc metallohydrolase 1
MLRRATPGTLTRRQLLARLSASTAAAFLPAFESEAAPLVYPLAPQKLDDGVWLIAGAQEAITAKNGGAIANIVILDTSAGAVIVDTGPSKRFGEQLAAVAKELTGKDIARVYLTHIHPDHVFGNQAFKREALAATEGVAKGLKAMGDGYADAMYRIAGDWMRGTEVVLPGTVVTTGVEDFGNRRLRLLAMRGHTASDLVLFDERSGFLIAGDLVFLDRAPTTPNANLEHWRIALANLGGIPHRRLVPGHGPAEDSGRGIEDTRLWIGWLEEQIRSAFEKGLDVTEAIALPLPDWTGRIALARYEYERSVMHLYPRFEAERLPNVGKRG